MRMGSSRFARRVAVGLLAGATAVGLSVSAGAASAAPQTRHPLTGSTPKWLPFARDMGTTVLTDPVNFGVLLGMRDQAGAEATLKAVSDPHSASYGHYLTSKQFDARYAPAPSSVAAVRNWLRDQGFKVTRTLPSGMYVAVSGTVGQVETTFGSKIHNYSYQGKQVYANTSQLSLPAGTPTAVSGAISGIVGVDQGSELKQVADPEHGPPLFKAGQFSQIIPEADGFDNTDLCGAQGWYGEETLDVEAVHAMAPGENVIYVGASDCLSGLDLAWANIIDSHFADVVTNSWTDGVDDV